MRWLILFLLTPLLLHAADEDGTWSKPVNGLQARLFISPLKKGDDGRLHMGLYFQMQSHDGDEELMRVAYNPGTLHLKAVDQNGKELKTAPAGGNQQELLFWKPLILPGETFMSIRVGGSTWEGSGKWLGEYLDFHFWTRWLIPPPDETTYYLTGKFTIPNPAPDQTGLVWSGTLELPKVEIPRVPYN
jgi:hypothetical protein